MTSSCRKEDWLSMKGDIHRLNRLSIKCNGSNQFPYVQLTDPNKQKIGSQSGIPDRIPDRRFAAIKTQRKHLAHQMPCFTKLENDFECGKLFGNNT